MLEHMSADCSARIGKRIGPPGRCKNDERILVETRTNLFRFADESHQRGPGCRLIREMRSAARRPPSRCARSDHHEDLKRNCAALGAIDSISPRKRAGGARRFSEGCKRPVARRKFAGAEFIRSPLVTAPPYQRSNELTRKGSAPVVAGAAGAAVLSTTTLVPTRARL